MKIDLLNDYWRVEAILFSWAFILSLKKTALPVLVKEAYCE